MLNFEVLCFLYLYCGIRNVLTLIHASCGYALFMVHFIAKLCDKARIQLNKVNYQPKATTLACVLVRVAALNANT